MTVDYEIELYKSLLAFLIASKNGTAIDHNYIDVDKMIESLRVKLEELEYWQRYINQQLDNRRKRENPL